MKSILVLLTLSLVISTQGQGVSELKQQIDTCSSDSVKSLLYGRLAMQYRRSNPDSAFFYISKGISVAKKINNLTCLSSMHNGLGNIHFFQSNYDSCIFYYASCLKMAQQLKDSLRMGAMYNNLGLVHSYQTKYDTALELLHKAYQIREKLGDESITSSVNNIGLVYQKMEAWEKALEYYKEAARLKEQYDQKLSLSNTLNNIGIVLKNMGRHEEAIPYYERSLAIAIEFNDKTKEANAHNNLAAVYHDNPDMIGLAGEHYQKSIGLKKEMGDKAGLANSYSNYAKWMMDTGKPTEAIKYIQLSEELNEELGKNLYSSKISRFKADIYKQLGNYDEAFKALNLAYNLREEELSEDLNNRIADLEVKFETTRKEAEIERLSLEAEIQKAEIQNTQIIILVGGSSAILIVILLLLYYRQRTRKLKAEQEAQDLQIEALQKRLLDLNISPSEPKVDVDQLNKKIHTPLSDREFEVLRLTLDGKSNSEIADQLFVSVSTVKFHLRNTYGKLGVNNRKEALDYVVKSS
ncbi:tetratricopeptide repeat protein [Ekhidna sp. MALMAid0563]|uniref:tetratricopeptide repeat protein n=1 Tax=Ekhidna sp. MALMAid0563 TaxID=3143937 RepID=UPI0032E0412B